MRSPDSREHQDICKKYNRSVSSCQTGVFNEITRFQGAVPGIRRSVRSITGVSAHVRLVFSMRSPDSREHQDICKKYNRSVGSCQTGVFNEITRFQGASGDL